MVFMSHQTILNPSKLPNVDNAWQNKTQGIGLTIQTQVPIRFVLGLFVIIMLFKQY